jgi:exonuclease VII large subunit
MIYDNKISLLSKTLESYDVQRVLKRGFVLVKQNSKFVTRAFNFNKDKKTQLNFYDGEITIH